MQYTNLFLAITCVLATVSANPIPVELAKRADAKSCQNDLRKDWNNTEHQTKGACQNIIDGKPISHQDIQDCLPLANKEDFPQSCRNVLEDRTKEQSAQLQKDQQQKAQQVKAEKGASKQDQKKDDKKNEQKDEKKDQ